MKSGRVCRLIFIVCFVFLLVSLFFFLEKNRCCQRSENALIASKTVRNTGDNENSIVEKELQRIFSQGFGYTLIGEKPISIEYCCELEFSSNRECRKQFFITLSRLFAGSTRFLLKTFHCTDSYSEVILVDVSAIMKLIKNDQYLFSFVNKEYGSVRNFYRSLVDPKLHIVDCFKRDVVAIGIALGYGEENSRYYQRYLDIGFYLKKYPLVCLLPFDPKPTPEIITEGSQFGHFWYDIPYRVFVPDACKDTVISMEDEWHWMRSVKNNDHDETQIPYLFQLPFFISKKGEETDRVCKKYDRARSKLSKLFYDRKFSEVIAEEVAKK